MIQVHVYPQGKGHKLEFCRCEPERKIAGVDERGESVIIVKHTEDNVEN